MDSCAPVQPGPSLVPWPSSRGLHVPGFEKGAGTARALPPSPLAPLEGLRSMPSWMLTRPLFICLSSGGGDVAAAGPRLQCSDMSPRGDGAGCVRGGDTGSTSTGRRAGEGAVLRGGDGAGEAAEGVAWIVARR
jgi:hypothetical protein